MKDIFYVNSKGERLNLLETPYLLQTGEFFNYEWKYRYKMTSMNGGEITGFNKEIEERNAVLSIVNYGKDNYEKTVDHFFETVEYDVIHKNPGRLYYGESYISCFIIESKKKDWETDSSLLDNEIMLLIPYPYWMKEQYFELYPKNDERSDDSIGLKYPYRYPYEYATTHNLQYLQNDNFSESNFEMIIFGPVINPQVRIAGNLYEVETTLYEEEYLVINSITRRIVKYKINGDTEILFHYRNRDSNIFQKIPKGRQPVTWPGTFGVNITLFHERSEPPWIL